MVEEIRLEKKGYPFYRFIGFVKLREGKYLVDLDGNGLFEFAVVRYGSDRNRFTKAQIYTLQKDGSLKFHRTGTYNKDLGKYVLFGCPDCHTINIDGCKSCY